MSKRTPATPNEVPAPQTKSPTRKGNPPRGRPLGDEVDSNREHVPCSSRAEPSTNHHTKGFVEAEQSI